MPAIDYARQQETARQPRRGPPFRVPRVFWRRGAALTVDLGILFPLMFPVAVLLVHEIPLLAHNPWRWLLLPVLSLGLWPYWALLESSRFGGTFGKKVAGLSVLADDASGLPPTAGRASLRWGGKLGSSLLGGAGYWPALEGEGQRAAHDWLAKTRVKERPPVRRPVRIVAYLVALVAIVLALKALPWPSELACSPAELRPIPPAQLPDALPQPAGVARVDYQEVSATPSGYEATGIVYASAHEAAPAFFGALMGRAVDATDEEVVESSGPIRTGPTGGRLAIDVGPLAGSVVEFRTLCRDQVGFALSLRESGTTSP